MAKKIIIAVVIVFVLVAGTRYFLARRQVAQQIAQLDFSAFVYPGSHPRDSDSFAKRLSERDRARLVKAEVYVTDDPPDKVISYYKDKLKGKSRSMDYQRKGKPTGFFEVEVGNNRKFIMITPDEESQKTEILISNVLPAQAK